MKKTQAGRNSPIGVSTRLDASYPHGFVLLVQDQKNAALPHPQTPHFLHSIEALDIAVARHRQTLDSRDDAVCALPVKTIQVGGGAVIPHDLPQRVGAHPLTRLRLFISA